MVTKKESGRRAMELSFELPGTPEQIWQAIATGPGICAWFVPSEVEEREGGAVVFHLGPGMDSSGKVTVWDPPRRFCYEEPNWSGAAPPIATELVIETRSGGTCTVRLVHSLFTSDDQWDDQLDGMESGWPPFFAVLRLYLLHFPGLPATSIRPTGSHDGPQTDAWNRLLELLGLAGCAIGQRCKVAAGSGAPSLAGVVERIDQNDNYCELMLLLDEPMGGVAMVSTYVMGERVNVAISAYFYGADAARVAAREDPLWQSWLAEHFPAPADTTAHS